MNHLLPENSRMVCAALYIYKSEMLFCTWQASSRLSSHSHGRQKTQRDNREMMQALLIRESAGGPEVSG